ncbi:hypothetical protein HMPREF3223_01164 [Cutibacterium avidum]|nr:hypothetical protein HMPREF3223_01164 [Cutibacterium avidum]
MAGHEMSFLVMGVMIGMASTVPVERVIRHRAVVPKTSGTRV